MNIRDILIFGLMLESDVFAPPNDIGTIREDEDLYKKAICKWYGVDMNCSDEEGERIDNEITYRCKELVELYREDIKKYINE